MKRPDMEQMQDDGMTDAHVLWTRNAVTVDLTDGIQVNHGGLQTLQTMFNRSTINYRAV